MSDSDWLMDVSCIRTGVVGSEVGLGIRVRFLVAIWYGQSRTASVSSIDLLLVFLFSFFFLEIQGIYVHVSSTEPFLSAY
jgi:hypothetical protein